MKTFIKIAAALAAIAGAVYVAVTYGDKIVAWVKSKLGTCKCCCGGECDCDCDGDCDCDCDCNCGCEEIEETADEVVAAETDFEG